MRATYGTITLKNGKKQREITIDCTAKEYKRVCEILTNIIGDGEWQCNWCADNDYMTTCFEVYSRDEYDDFMVDWKEAKKHC